MSNQSLHTSLGSLVSGSLGAWFVAVGELDLDPAWSFAKKMLIVILGGLLAGVTHQLGTKLAGLMGAGWTALVARLRSKKKQEEEKS